MTMFLEEETRMIKTMVDKIVRSGVNIVICQKGIDDVALEYLTKASISAIFEEKDIIQFDATIIAGILILLTIGSITGVIPSETPGVQKYTVFFRLTIIRVLIFASTFSFHHFCSFSSHTYE
jgi:hypothetical protein